MGGASAPFSAKPPPNATGSRRPHASEQRRADRMRSRAPTRRGRSLFPIRKGGADSSGGRSQSRWIRRSASTTTSTIHARVRSRLLTQPDRAGPLGASGTALARQWRWTCFAALRPRSTHVHGVGCQGQARASSRDQAAVSADWATQLRRRPAESAPSAALVRMSAGEAVALHPAGWIFGLRRRETALRPRPHVRRPRSPDAMRRTWKNDRRAKPNPAYGSSVTFSKAR